MAHRLALLAISPLGLVAPSLALLAIFHPVRQHHYLQPVAMPGPGLHQISKAQLRVPQGPALPPNWVATRKDSEI